jgi:S-adenosylmethionine hydrolase
VRRSDGSIEGDVLVIDRFGNAITNLPPSARGVVQVGRVAIPVRGVYADGAIGEAVAVVGSHGSIEIAVRNDSAARVLGISRGDKVILLPNS